MNHSSKEIVRFHRNSTLVDDAIFRRMTLSKWKNICTDLPWYFKYIRNLTEKMCFAAVQQNGRALQYVPPELRSEEMCFIAVQRNGYALQYVPLELRSEEICLIAVQQNGQALYYVPPELRSEKICRVAIQQNRMALCYVPAHLKHLFN